MGYVFFAGIFVVLDFFFLVLYPLVMIFENNYFAAFFSLGVGVMTIMITLFLLGAAQDADNAPPDRVYEKPEASHRQKICSLVDKNAPSPDYAKWPGIKTVSHDVVKGLGLAFLLAFLLFIVLYLVV